MSYYIYDPKKWKKSGLKFKVPGLYSTDDGSTGKKRTSLVGGPQGPLGPLGFPKKSLIGQHLLIDGHVYKVTRLAGLNGEAVPVDTPDAGIGGVIVGAAALLFAAALPHAVTTTIEGVEVIACEDPVVSVYANRTPGGKSDPLLYHFTTVFEVKTNPGFSDFITKVALSDNFGFYQAFTDKDFSIEDAPSGLRARLSLVFATSRSSDFRWQFGMDGGVIFWGDNICPPPFRTFDRVIGGGGAIQPFSVVVL